MTDKPRDDRSNEPHEDYSEDARLPDLPELAQHWLSQLSDIGLQELAQDQEAHFKQAEPEKPVIHSPEGDLRPVRLGDHRQVFWLRLDGSRTEDGYKNVEVLDKPLKTQTAIIALLTILEANQIKVELLRKASAEMEPPLERYVNEHYVNERWFASWWDWEGNKWNKNIQWSIRWNKFRYVLALLRYYRPDFDDLSLEEQVGLIRGASERLNSFLAASRRLVEFLEYGSPERELRRAAENASRDVRAAVLKDVEGLGSIQIAERFGLRIRKSYQIKNEHKGVIQMINRGRKMLEGALGEDGWQQQIEAMKADAKRFHKLSTKEKSIQTLVDLGMPIKEARRQVEETIQRGDSLWLPIDPD